MITQGATAHKQQIWDSNPGPSDASAHVLNQSGAPERLNLQALPASCWSTPNRKDGSIRACNLMC